MPTCYRCQGLRCRVASNAVTYAQARQHEMDLYLRKETNKVLNLSLSCHNEICACQMLHLRFSVTTYLH